MNRLKKLFLWGFVFFSTCNRSALWAQVGYDSIRVLSKSSNDTLKALALLEMGRKHLFTDLDSFNFYLNEGYWLSANKKFEKGIAIFYELKSVSKRVRGYYDGVLDTANLALKIFEKLNYKKGIANIYNVLGAFYSENGSTNEGIKYYFKSLKIREQIRDTAGMAACFNNLGLTYGVFEKNYSKGIEFLKKSLALHQRINNTGGVGSTLISLGIAYNSFKQYDSSLIYYRQAVERYKAFKKSKNLSLVYNNMSTTFISLNKFDSALKYTKLAIEIQEKNDDPLGLMIAYINLSIYYENTTNFNKALDYALKAYRLSSKINALSDIETSSHQVFKIYKKMGDFKKALEFHEIYTQNHDSIYTIEKNKQTQNLQTRYEMEKKEVEIRALEQEYNHKLAIKNLEKNSLFFFLLLVVFIAVGIFWTYTKIKRKNTELVKTQNQLNQTIEEVKLFSLLANKTDNIIIMTDEEGKIVWVNDYFTKVTEFELSEVKGKKPGSILQGRDTDPNAISILRQSIKDKKPQQTEILNYSKSGKPYWVSTTINPLFDEKGKLVRYFAIQNDVTTIKNKISEIEIQKSKIEDLFNSQTANINYAKKIQEAVFPSKEVIKRIFPESFLYFRPKDVVSGDFYWLKDINDQIVVAVGDCTGHGVYGAFTSLLAINLLEKAILFSQSLEPSKILKAMAENFFYTYTQNNPVEFGLEIGLAVIDNLRENVSFAGLKHNFYIVENGNLIELKGERLSLSSKVNLPAQFEKIANHSAKLTPASSCYLFSDGFKDQFGGKQKERFGKKNC